MNATEVSVKTTTLAWVDHANKSEYSPSLSTRCVTFHTYSDVLAFWGLCSELPARCNFPSFAMGVTIDRIELALQ